ncbi:STAS domain-containing protein [Streptomyces sp. NPDC087908]|uniref:STAS domain-containing protein n=1 Tax=Streptomyces sp. NPDC087908 TaxID=3365820 RepID=UPI00382F5134
MTTHPRHLHLDLTNLTFCDTTGLHALHQLTHQAHIHLHLTGTPHACTALSPHSTRPPTPHTPTTQRY